MMACFERRASGRIPFGGYSVVVTDDVLEIPLEAQGLAMFGAQPRRRRSAVRSG